MQISVPLQTQYFAVFRTIFQHVCDFPNWNSMQNFATILFHQTLLFVVEFFTNFPDAVNDLILPNFPEMFKKKRDLRDFAKLNGKKS